MDNVLTDDTKTIILLCGVIGKKCSVNPLAQKDYTVLVRWLISENMRPMDLLQQENISLAAQGSGLDRERLKTLLGRGVQLGFAVEEWQRNSIWIISSSDLDYPVRLKNLKDRSGSSVLHSGDIPVLFFELSLVECAIQPRRFHQLLMRALLH